LFPSSDEGEKTATPLVPLERVVVTERTETDPVSKTLCFLLSRIPDDGQSPTEYYTLSLEKAILVTGSEVP
jgi:hypothetical protein